MICGKNDFEINLLSVVGNLAELEGLAGSGGQET
jgi:hypothetical protein